MEELLSKLRHSSYHVVIGSLKALVNDTLLPMIFLGQRNLGNICCGHKMFLNKIRNIFCVLDTKLVSATNAARAGKRGNICVGNNVSSFTRAFKAPSTLIRFQTKTELFCSGYGYRPHYNAENDNRKRSH